MFGLVSGMGIASGAALYFMQPKTLPRQICVVAASSFLVWGITKIAHLWSLTTNEHVIARICELKKDHSVHLFVGRQADEDLPKSGDKEVWVSLDKEANPSYIKEHPDRLHLVMLVDDIEQMRTIRGLFSKVVVDLSVTKFFGDSALINLTKAVAPEGSLMIPQISSPRRNMVLSFTSPSSEISYFAMEILFDEDEEHQKQIWNFAAKKLGCEVELKNSAEAKNFFETNEQDIERIPGFEDSESVWYQESETYQKCFSFFNHLAEKEQKIQHIYETRKIKCMDKIEQYLSQNFDQVNIYNDKFPYQNNWDLGGKKPTTYVYAEGRKYT